MLSAYNENNIQALAAVRHLTGVEIRLGPLDEITAIESTDQGFNVWITVYRWQDLKRGIRVTARGVKLVQVAERLVDSSGYYTEYHGRGACFIRKSTAWDAEQCGAEMMDAIRRQDMEDAQHWMTLQTALEKLGPWEPFEIPAYGQRETVSEWAARVRRERMAGRVGTSSFPMDTYDRANQGYEDPVTERMVKHWKKA